MEKSNPTEICNELRFSLHWADSLPDTPGVAAIQYKIL